jgi:hypothetical protein
MANLEVSYSSTVPNPTRQQLDELDLLLQQMLGLPVNPATEEADPGPAESADLEQVSPGIASEAESTAKPAAAPTLPLATVEEPEGELREPMNSSSETDGQAASTPGRLDHPSHEPELERIAALEQLEAQLSQKLQTPPDKGDKSRAQEPVRVDSRRPAGWLLPLVWCNQVFDWLTIPLGPLGRWLRGPSGRFLLGWTGLALLAAALAWSLVDLIRWIW